MPMKCVVCGQLTDAEAKLAKAQKDLALFDPAAVAAYGDKRARDAADARDAVWRWAVKESWRTHGECSCEPLLTLMEGRGSSTDRAPGRNPGDAGSSPAPSTPDEDKHG